MSLFDLEEPAVQVNTPTYQSLADVPHNYRLITTPIETAALVSEIQEQPRVAISLLGSGENAMQLKIMGIAVCCKPHEAAFIKCDGKQDMLRAMEPLFSGKATIVSSDVKRTMVALSRHGIQFTAPYYDTAVAHYLLQPERGHSTA
jgi:DNA polymerase-1